MKHDQSAVPDGFDLVPKVRGGGAWDKWRQENGRALLRNEDNTHFHAILSAPELPKVLHHLKSFTAKQIVAQLPLEGRDWLLNQLQYFRAAHKSTIHQIWQEGVHPQAIFSDEMLLQKMEYLHNNPVKRGWVSSPEHWRYSSAHEWLPGAIPVIRCDPWQ